MTLIHEQNRRTLGKTGISIPPIVFGTSALGNLYAEIPFERKREIAKEWFSYIDGPVALDSAGKYGAGLALETIGRALRELGVPPDRVLLSNKLGWKRVPMTGSEPTFEQGVWFGLTHDAVSSISYNGILECFEQGNGLLGGRYTPSLVSVHDPDEYLAAAGTDPGERDRRLDDVLDAYRALGELRKAGVVAGVGVGAKDWNVIREISKLVELDWVMLACSLTVHTHPKQLLDFVASLAAGNVGIINSAVFNAGFLTGGEFYDYRRPDRTADAELFRWRERFFALCRHHEVAPADACIEFGLSVPGTAAVALNTGNPARVQENVRSVLSHAPAEFWDDMKAERLVAADYPYLGTANRAGR